MESVTPYEISTGTRYSPGPDVVFCRSVLRRWRIQRQALEALSRQNIRRVSGALALDVVYSTDAYFEFEQLLIKMRQFWEKRFKKRSGKSILPSLLILIDKYVELIKVMTSPAGQRSGV
ncbi:hypothetical protein AXG93_3884s1020 [Marchantia polymorpha subsp. ruderalis]|uniref:Uncharacterized protein n=1 Tax=Marchantia polymorpha subsp. ruderalis TaxID=1480154 RepID=A0A176W9J3_MARPO|nr:hypothetical protein AXG93_3884s1020 [Marchantia polymorpha subsp. ruderalis]